MRNNKWSRSGSGGEYVAENIMLSCFKTKQMLLPRKSTRKSHPPEATVSNSKTKAPRKDPPVGNKNDVVGKKRKSPNNKTPTNPKRSKPTATSNSEARPLITADIPDIVAAVADANRRDKPAQGRTSRWTLKSGNRTSQDDLPSEDSQLSAIEESMEHEDFGKCNCTTRCTLC